MGLPTRIGVRPESMSHSAFDFGSKLVCEGWEEHPLALRGRSFHPTVRQCRLWSRPWSAESAKYPRINRAKYRFSRTLDDPWPPTGVTVLVFQGILGNSEPDSGRLHQK